MENTERERVEGTQEGMMSKLSMECEIGHAGEVLERVASGRIGGYI